MIKLIIIPGFDAWLSRVRDRQAATAITGRLKRAALGNLGYWRAVGDGIPEMKIDVGKGYRVDFTQRGDVLVIILCGGDKSTQSAHIKRAKAIAQELED
ncbi:type II toxin-antitoxin system RelE/ParE family toxin [Paraburkholderia sp. CNPSo 3272]|uniref:type II toxin-antitoxin system RelE/ParE family toxin n=1 Tax=Paraburkholderia sp. CNPSo 3272 TaxID=2940931 RepID=UPI0020B8F794|nr:type II toxin-antitoxin system RelE/ParE family toxin [Paraburkholderia sp. CNPSo 3272]MCP3727534.1 type II toxin-antitoxin system RelE/ParE family toxin [Paraburkholderia sp. CNPSo 3272]